MINEKMLAAKKKLRHHLLGLRRHLSVEERESRSACIWQQLRREKFYRQAKCVFCYASMPDEVQTHAILEHMLQNGKRVCLPRIVAKGIMDAVELSSMEDLVPGDFGILTVSDEKGTVISPEEIDCVLVPGAGFGRDGARLGMGGGYYDRFLMTRARQALRIAAAFSCQLSAEIPMEPHDCRVDAVITEDEMILCNKMKW